MAGRTLIFGTSYVANQEQAYVFELWRNLARTLNPGMEIFVVDSASPCLPDLSFDHLFVAERFQDNIGHQSRGEGDGWGRAWSWGLSYAARHEFDWAVHIECDLLFAYPVAEIIAKLERADVKIAAPIASPYQMMETALMFMNVNKIKELDLVKRYDWKNGKGVPEARVQRIVQEDLFFLPLYGCRDDAKQLTPANLKEAFPNGVSWLTHASPAVYREFLRMHGHG